MMGPCYIMRAQNLVVGDSTKSEATLAKESRDADVMSNIIICSRPGLSGCIRKSLMQLKPFWKEIRSRFLNVRLGQQMAYSGKHGTWWHIVEPKDVLL